MSENVQQGCQTCVRRAGAVFTFHQAFIKLAACVIQVSTISVPALGVLASEEELFERDSVFLSTSRPSFVRAFLEVMRAVLVCWPLTAIADAMRTPPVSPPSTVVVTAKRGVEIVPDEQLQIQVETALHDDPYFYDEHVTVTVRNGVVFLEGIVFDDGDAQAARLIVKRRVAGPKRLVSNLEICACDGGA